MNDAYIEENVMKKNAKRYRSTPQITKHKGY